MKTTKPLPIYLYSKEFWDNLINFEYLIEIGTISREDMKLFQFVNSPEEAFALLKKDLKTLHDLTDSSENNIDSFVNPNDLP
jgi:predicted Rossmann-fold nucleotide-binding protein